MYYYIRTRYYRDEYLKAQDEVGSAKPFCIVMHKNFNLKSSDCFYQFQKPRS